MDKKSDKKSKKDSSKFSYYIDNDVLPGSNLLEDIFEPNVTK